MSFTSRRFETGYEEVIFNGFVTDVKDERHRQIEKFGYQELPDGTGSKEYEWQADRARTHYDYVAALGEATWADVLLEEVYEALAEDNLEDLDKELTEVAAVCAAWKRHIAIRRANGER